MCPVPPVSRRGGKLVSESHQKKPRRKYSVHQRVTMAGRRGDGLRLSPDDVLQLCEDEAIQTAADNHDEYDHFLTRPGPVNHYRS